MPLLAKGAREDRSNLSRSAGNHNLHGLVRLTDRGPRHSPREAVRSLLPTINGHVLIVNVFTENSKPRRRGRPPGRTAEGEAARRRLYETAIALIGERGYEGATLRDVAARAGVSPALLYRYFPSKRSVVLALYDELSDRFAA